MIKELKANIWKLNLFNILTAMMFFLPVIVLFWKENGLNMTEIMILQSIYSLVVVFLEVPSGYFADVFGRKTALLIGAGALVGGVFIYAISYDFITFLMAEFFWGAGTAFISGADTALLYDSLFELKSIDRYKKLVGNFLFYGMLATAIASIAGGLIGKISFRYTLFAVVPFMIFAFLLSLTFKEPDRHKRIFKKGYLAELFKILKYCFMQKKIRWLIVYSAVLVGFNMAALWLYQPYFELTGLDIAYFGFVFAAFNVISGLSSKYAHEIEAFLGSKKSLIFLVLLVSVSYFLMSNFIVLLGFSFAFLQQFVRGVERPIVTDYINRLTSSDIRATVLSAESLVGRLFYALIIPAVGWIVDVYSLVQALTVLGFTVLILGSAVLLIMHKDKVL